MLLWLVKSAVGLQSGWYAGQRTVDLPDDVPFQFPKSSPQAVRRCYARWVLAS